MSKLERRLTHQTHGLLRRLAHEVNVGLTTEKGFTCWEQPTTSTVRATSPTLGAAALADLVRVHAALTNNLEQNGYCEKHTRGPQTYWYKPLEGKHAYYMVTSPHHPPNRYDAPYFDVTPLIYTSEQTI